MVATPEKWSKVPANNGSADRDCAFPELMLASALNDQARNLMSGVANILDDQGGGLTSSGSSTAYVLTTNQSIDAYADGLRFSFVAHIANSGAATGRLNGLAALFFYKATPTGMAQLTGGEIVIDGHYDVQYDASLNASAGGLVILNPTPAFLGTPAPTDAQYVTLAANSTLTQERVLAVSTSLTLTDGGAGNALTLATAPLTGDITTPAGSPATTIAANAVTNGKLADMATQTIKARITGTTGDPEDATPTQVFTLLNTLAEDAAPDLSNDFVLTFDASASTAKKVKLLNARVTEGVYTPTVASVGGSLTLVQNRAGRYWQTGNSADVLIQFDITTNGTGSNALDVSLPFAFILGVANGVESSTNKGVQGTNSGASTVRIRFADASYPGVSGGSYVLWYSGRVS
jgi:hypothetical protein